jgi:integrase
LIDLETWKAKARSKASGAFVFPSERMTPLSKDNCWRRDMLPKLVQVGLGWANFLVMRRTHATLMKELGVDAKTVADQLGHEVDVDINTYTLTSVAVRQAAVNRLESALAAKQGSYDAQENGTARKLLM